MAVYFQEEVFLWPHEYYNIMHKFRINKFKRKYKYYLLNNLKAVICMFISIILRFSSSIRIKKYANN